MRSWYCFLVIPLLVIPAFWPPSITIRVPCVILNVRPSFASSVTLISNLTGLGLCMVVIFQVPLNGPLLSFMDEVCAALVDIKSGTARPIVWNLHISNLIPYPSTAFPSISLTCQRKKIRQGVTLSPHNGSISLWIHEGSWISICLQNGDTPQQPLWCSTRLQTQQVRHPSCYWSAWDPSLPYIEIKLRETLMMQLH